MFQVSCRFAFCHLRAVFQTGHWK